MDNMTLLYGFALFVAGIGAGSALTMHFRYAPLMKELNKMEELAIKFAHQNAYLMKKILGIPVFESKDGHIISPIQINHGNSGN